MLTLVKDLRFALRMLVRNPGFAIVAAVTLSLGIGVNTSIFTIVNVLVLRPPPVAEPAGLIRFTSLLPDREYLHYRDHSRTMTGLFAYAWTLPTLDEGGGEEGEAEILHGLEASANYFSALRVQPALGRLFLPGDAEAAGSAPVVVLSHRIWRTRFGADPSLIGRSIRLNGRPHLVAGVAQPGFEGTNVLAADLWIPVSAEQGPDRAERSFWVQGRLRPGVTLEQARREASPLLESLAALYPDLRRPEPRRIDSAASLIPMSPPLAAAISLLMSAVAMVLLIACANVASLFMARAAAREREIAARLSLGATRGRLVRQLLTESTVVALLGGALGLLLSAWSLPVIAAAVNRSMPRLWGAWLVNFDPDFRVFGYTFGLSLVTGTVFGLAPALRASQVDLAGMLKGSRQEWLRSRLHGGLVVAQVALCLVLLINAGLLARSLANAQKADPGFDADHIVIVQLDLFQRERDAARAGAIEREILDRLAALPGVEAVAAASHVPLLRTRRIAASEEGSAVSRTVPFNSVSAGYFDAMRIPIVRGRGFTTSEARDGVEAVVVSEGAARLFWPGENPLGKRIAVGEPGGAPYLRSAAVIGVARDTRSAQLSEIDPAYLYLPLSARDPLVLGAHLFVRGAGSAETIAGPVRRAAREVVRDATLLVYSYQYAIYYQRIPAQAGAAVSLTLGLLALVLAAVGIYGVISWSVTRRTHEIGVRMALGAARRDVIALVLGQGAKLIVIGIGLGVLGAIPLARFLSAILVGVSPLDPPTFAGVSAFLAAVAVAAMWIPARWASKVEPVVALRHE